VTLPTALGIRSARLLLEILCVGSATHVVITLDATLLTQEILSPEPQLGERRAPLSATGVVPTSGDELDADSGGAVVALALAVWVRAEIAEGRLVGVGGQDGVASGVNET
jgi:hypothetical protein